MIRFRRPVLKDGELRIQWGKLPHENPDIVYSWQGEHTMKRDTAFLCYVLGSKRPDPLKDQPFAHMQPSVWEELDARGYDLTTLRFSIMKKATKDQPCRTRGEGGGT